MEKQQQSHAGGMHAGFVLFIACKTVYVAVLDINSS